MPGRDGPAAFAPAQLADAVGKHVGAGFPADQPRRWDDPVVGVEGAQDLVRVPAREREVPGGQLVEQDAEAEEHAPSFQHAPKRALPLLPRRIGLVTGNDAAAKRDVIATWVDHVAVSTP